MPADSYDYFDEDYFERGENRGTAYRNYLESSRKSTLYAEIADACTTFRPVRALEIGCATGIIVKQLNEFGVETYGIDVSEWAISNHEHPNVLLAGAENLPFPDDYFDLVFSVHALEHIPVDLKEAAFREIARVSKPTAFQFHTLPMIGMGPYVGERDVVIQQLKKDPTHNLLFEKSWWVDNFRDIGFEEFGGRIYFAHEAEIDLSDSQLVLRGAGNGNDQIAAALENIHQHNLKALANLQRRAKVLETGFYTHASYSQVGSVHLANTWGDIDQPCNIRVTEDIIITGQVSVRTSGETLTLRFCFLGENGEEADFTLSFRNGTTIFQFKPAMMMNRKGKIVGAQVKRWLFGGIGSGDISATFAIET